MGDAVSIGEFQSQRSWAPDPIIMVEMEEILTKIDDADIPLREWEYYALCLMEGNDLGEAKFWVRQLNASWSRIISMSPLFLAAASP